MAAQLCPECGRDLAGSTALELRAHRQDHWQPDHIETGAANAEPRRRAAIIEAWELDATKAEMQTKLANQSKVS